jgi:hypothetical protein
MLLARTEELRTLDVRRAEIAAELESARSHERELKMSVDELREARERDRVQWLQDSRHLRELVERRLQETEPEIEHEEVTPQQAHAPAKPAEPQDGEPSDNPVIASVMGQFGKLRQQRALDRPALKKTR